MLQGSAFHPFSPFSFHYYHSCPFALDLYRSCHFTISCERTYQPIFESDVTPQVKLRP